MPIVVSGNTVVITGRAAVPYAQVLIEFFDGEYGREYIVIADGVILFGNHRLEKGQYFDIANQIAVLSLPVRADIALIGGAAFVLGAVLNRLHPWVRKDVYEICVGFYHFMTNFRDSNRLGWNWVIGDWQETITGLYDVIVYDADEGAINAQLLRDHLAPGGHVIFFHP